MLNNIVWYELSTKREPVLPQQNILWIFVIIIIQAFFHMNEVGYRALASSIEDLTECLWLEIDHTSTLYVSPKFLAKVAMRMIESAANLQVRGTTFCINYKL